MSKRIMRLLAVALAVLLVNASVAYAGASGTDATSPVTPTSSGPSDPALQGDSSSSTLDEEDDHQDAEDEDEPEDEADDQGSDEEDDALEAALEAQAEALDEVEEEMEDGVVITLPQDGSVTSDAAIDISGLVKDGYTVKVKVENAGGEQVLTVPVNADGTFNLADLPLEPGKNSIKLSVYDASGKKVGEVEKRIVKPGAAMAKLTDVKGNWAEDVIAKLVAMGIVNGTADGTFQPQEKVEGAQFIKMLSLAANLNTDNQAMKGFQDLPDGFWASQYIGAAESHGIVKGDNDEAFDPTQPLTRAQMAVLLIRALGLEDQAEALAEQSGATQFSDASSVPEWARGSVELAARLGLIKGMDDGTFRPNLPADRAQAAALIERFLQLKETVNPVQPATGTTTVETTATP